MKIFLTGSSGALGSDTRLCLGGAGFEVAAFDSHSLDITDKKSVWAAVKEARPEVIINCAAYTRVDLAETEAESALAVNRDGVENLAKAAAKVDAAVIHVSTDYVFDGKKSSPYTEGDETNPLCVYGKTKLAGEEALRQYPKHLIIRSSWLYGAAPRGNNFVKTILRLAAEKDVIRVVYDQTGCPTWTKDLAGVIVLAAKALGEGGAPGSGMPFGIYHYSNEGVASWYDFAMAIIEEAWQYTPPFKVQEVIPILSHEYPLPAKRPAYSVMCKDKIKKAPGPQRAGDLKIPYWRASLKKMLAEFYGKTPAGGARAGGARA